MTMSPYDNLPIGKNKQNAGEVRYEEVSFEPPEASGSPDTQAKAGEPYPVSYTHLKMKPVT